MNITKFTIGVAVILTAQSAAYATSHIGGGVSIKNTISGNMAVGQNGTATSYAENKQSASAGVGASSSTTGNYSSPQGNGIAAFGLTGATAGSSSGQAYNVSTGTGNGTASSIGSYKTEVAGGNQSFSTGPGTPNAVAGIKLLTQSNNEVAAKTNTGSYVQGATESAASAQLQFTRTFSSTNAAAGATGGATNSTVTVADQKTGYSMGWTKFGSLEGMNAAGKAEIGASGTFFSKAEMDANTANISPR